MVVAFRNICESLAALPAPDPRLLLVLDIVVVEFRNDFEGFATRSTLEQRLLLTGIMVRLGTLSCM